MGCSIWSGCWGGWRWIRRGRARWWRWRGRWRCLPGVVAAVKEFATDATRGRSWARALDPLEDLHEMIVRTIVEEPPVSLGDGGAIREGVDAELDELRELEPKRAAGDRGD